jgi:hypothetical protein
MFPDSRYDTRKSLPPIRSSARIGKSSPCLRKEASAARMARCRPRGLAQHSEGSTMTVTARSALARRSGNRHYLLQAPRRSPSGDLRRRSSRQLFEPRHPTRPRGMHRRDTVQFPAGPGGRYERDAARSSPFARPSRGRRISVQGQVCVSVESYRLDADNSAEHLRDVLQGTLSELGLEGPVEC